MRGCDPVTQATRIGFVPGVCCCLHLQNVSSGVRMDCSSDFMSNCPHHPRLLEASLRLPE